MKVNMNKRQVAKAVRAVTNLALKSDVEEHLQCYTRLEIDAKHASGFSLYTTNQDSGAKVFIPASVITSGNCVVAADEFAAAIRLSKGDVSIYKDYSKEYSEADLCIADSGVGVTKLRVKQNDMPDVIMHGSSKDFLKENETLLGKVSVPFFLDTLKRSKHAMAKDDIRYYLNGVCIKRTEEGWEIVATDGHRLACAKITNTRNFVNAGDDETIIPNADVNLLVLMMEPMADMMKKNPGYSVSVGITRNDDNAVLFEFSDGSFYKCRHLQGKFPNYRRILDQNKESIENGGTLVVDAKRLMDEAKRAISVINGKRRDPKSLILEVKDSVLHLTGIRDGKPVTNASMEVIETDIDEHKVCLNASYLYDYLFANKGFEKVKMMLPKDIRDSIGINNFCANEECVIMPLGM